MNKRKDWFWIVGVVVILIVGAVVGGLGFLGRLPGQQGSLYQDPQGRFTMNIDPSWEQVKTDGSYTQFKVANPPMNMYLLVLKANTVKDAFSQALQTTGFDPGLLHGRAHGRQHSRPYDLGIMLDQARRRIYLRNLLLRRRHRP